MTKREDKLQVARASLRAKIMAVVGSEADMPAFEQALTHPSYAHESGLPSNQRLEFLGDAVLGLCASELLAEANPDADEGMLTRMRSAVVNGSALATWAREHDVGASIGLGKGASGGDERQQANVLADTVEALVACVYLAHGLPGAMRLVQRLLEKPILAPASLAQRDPKSELQEQVQALGYATPRYVVAVAEGPPHDAHFVIDVVVEAVTLGRGTGKSKKVAEREAAQIALASDYATALKAARGATA